MEQASLELPVPFFHFQMILFSPQGKHHLPPFELENPPHHR